ncbi:hypothetical protein EDF56_104394 [Novosphingobium sp. PhB165]|uniref:hypothetical protein n=1 Tax=Novosphingobium sp. PhB165 TaxID=2485105 RepID=UPI00104981D4|nr:hypothetical protein [Novosphingobium sp. PhB165]TCM18860.1 hypothetical protein EDF56_104394 [Novosphingobium sp. PhB165]
MNADRQRLVRLRRLEKIRAIAKQNAVLEAAQAESTLSQLKSLSDRTRQLAADYASRREMTDGAALHQVGNFISGLQAISRSTEGDAQRAQSIADAKQILLAAAERRRAAIEERATLQERMIAKASQTPALSGRRTSGTGLE